MQEKEFEYYLQHQEELLSEYNGKYIVLVGEKVVGAYDDASHAVHFSKRNLEPGTFIIQLCTPGNSAYTIHSCFKASV